MHAEGLEHEMVLRKKSLQRRLSFYKISREEVERMQAKAEMELVEWLPHHTGCIQFQWQRAMVYGLRQRRESLFWSTQ